MFSIITVTKNDFAGFRETHRSIQNQTFKDFEWIVIDGGSTDGTKQFLEEINPDQWVSENDAGIYDGMNKGIDRASGDYLIFMNGGDIFSNDDILKSVSNHTDKKYSIIYGDTYEARNDSLHLKKTRSLFRKAALPTYHQSIIYNRNVVDDIRYDTQYRIGADYLFTYKIYKQSSHVFNINRAISIFSHGGLSTKMWFEGIMDLYRIRKRHNVCGQIENVFYVMIQTAIGFLKKCCPRCFYALRRLLISNA